MGGVYAESGMETVGKWVIDLIYHCDEPPMKKIKSEPTSPVKPPLPIFFASQPPPSPQKEIPIPRGVQSINKEMTALNRQPSPFMKPAVHFPNPLAPAQPNLPFLPLFNQAASQRRCVVEYPAEFTGPSHAGKWRVQCVGEWESCVGK